MNIHTGDEERVEHAGHQLHRRPGQARHPAPQHDRRDVDESLRVGRWRRPRRSIRDTASMGRSPSIRTSRWAPYYARTSTPGLDRTTTAIRRGSTTARDRYGARAEYLKVGDNFNPEVGFLRRDNFKRSFASARFSPRPRNSRLVRKYTSEASLEYVENGAGFLESRQQTGALQHRVQQQRSLQRRSQPQLRLPDRAVHRRPRRDHPGRRLQLRRRVAVVHVRGAAPALGDGVACQRGEYLRRRHHARSATAAAASR